MKNKIFLISTLLAGLFIFSSCLKDDADYWKDDVSGKMYATVLKPQLQTVGLQPVAGDVFFSFMVNIATDQPPTQDISVVMAINPDAVTAYNNRFSPAKNYKVFPNIEILNPNVTIAKGTRTAIINVRVWGAEALDACDNFIAPIGISSVSGGVTIAGNMSTYICALPIANPYAANYHAVGYRNHPTAGIQPFDYASVEFSTVDCKTVHKDRVGNYTGYTLNVEVTSDIIVVGGVNCNKCILSIPEVGDDWTQQDDLAGAPMNYYNPTTKVFELYYWYNNAAPRILRETLTRL